MFKNAHLEDQNALSSRVYDYYNNKKQDRNLAQATDGYVFHHFGLGPTKIDTSKATDEEITAEVQRQEHDQTTRIIELLEYTDEQSSTLDIGCGRGGVMFRIADQYKDAKLDGINLTHYQTDYTNDEIKKRGLEDRAEVKQANFLSMPYPDESFTHEYCSEVTQYTLDLTVLFKEVSRTLKPNGKFVIATWCYAHDRADEALKEVIEPINDHYASTMHSDKTYRDALDNCNLKLIYEEDRSTDLIPYWELRNEWSMKSGIEDNFIKGHTEGLLFYKFFVVTK
jgi:cyclopropane fatty-acyl-phospholipid synthase-like methyltransferase